MSLSSESPSAVGFLLPGVVAGLVTFGFSRLMIEPLVGAAVEYEGAREHEHGHELFSRAIQENVGAAVGVVAFAVVMGVLFAVAYTALSAVLDRRGVRRDPTALALLLSAGMFVAIALLPSLKYPANPPGVGLEDTVGARSSAFLTITVVSVVAAIAAVAAGLAWSRRWGGWRAAALAVGGYAAVMMVAVALLPGFGEVPGPLTGPDGLVLGGFPAEVLAEFRMYSLGNQALMWLVIGIVWGGLAALLRSRRRALPSDPPVELQVR
ncbi:cobalt transporter [Mycolicibacterium moriokaense]|nr:cobalt transporter [Mycolicibacterium moriokaense]